MTKSVVINFEQDNSLQHKYMCASKIGKVECCFD